MNAINKIFKLKKPIIGMIHIRALPGTPKHKQPLSEIISIAVKEARLYERHGLNGVMLENMHDVPYLNRKVGAETTAFMTAIAVKVKKYVSLPLGIQILAGANKEALAVAKSAELDFIRAEGFVFSHIADEGLMNGDAAELLRYRKIIDAENIAVFTDIKKKHSAHAITADVSIAETAKAAEFFLSDGVIVTGDSTGSEAEISDLQAVKKAVDIPVFIGSGLTAENLEKYWKLADGFIVGSYFKKDGYWENEISEKRVEKLMNKVKQA